MGKMAAVREIHRQDPIAGFDRGKVDRHVGLRPAVRLHVDVLRAEDFLCAIDRQLLDHVDIFAAAIPAFARVAFGIFVRQAGSLRLHHGAAGEIFRGDQFDVFALAPFLRGDSFVDFRIDFAEGLA